MMAKSKSEAIQLSIRALQELLAEVCRRPLEYRDDQELIASLKSQGRLYGHYSNDRLGIRPCSINTVKKIAREVVLGGLSELDSLRTSAKNRVEEARAIEEKGNKRTRIGLKALADRQEHEIENLRHTNFLLLQAVSEARRDIESVAGVADAQVRKERSRQAVIKLAAMLALNPPPFNAPLSESNVEPVRPIR